MKLSKYLFKTNKNESSLDNATDRLIRGCFIQKECAGIFRFTNLGLKMVEKIKHVIRSELDNIGCLEVALPILQDINLWKKSGRDHAYGPERFSLKDRKDATMVLAPTAEESCTELISSIVSSYRQLPITVYQMIEKYRDEMRPRFGLVRSRQFIMKDAYSFAKDDEQATQIYVDIYNAYCRIFKNLGLNACAVTADTGEIGGKFSHEFVVLNDQIGETDLYYDHLYNSEIHSVEEFNKITASFDNKSLSNCKKSLELGHIFYLGDVYSKAMKAMFTDTDGLLKPFIMGCYGIGVTRILACLAETKAFFPEHLSPFKYHLIGINQEKSEEFYKISHNKLDILYDDRDQSTGTKFNDADIIGIPNRIIIGNNIEFKNMTTGVVETFHDMHLLLNKLLK
jgi:prolyl-tRNA synthetase